MAATKRDYYQVLGVKRDAGQDEIKFYFWQRAKECHPDRNPNNKAEAEERFKEINEAYQVLSDPLKREEYDAHKHPIPVTRPRYVSVVVLQVKAQARKPIMSRSTLEYCFDQAASHFKVGNWGRGSLLAFLSLMVAANDKQRQCRGERDKRAIYNPQSAICNPQSAIRNPQSSIRNREGHACGSNKT